MSLPTIAVACVYCAAALAAPHVNDGAEIDYNAARQTRRLQAAPITEPVVVDGHLDEPVWRTAPAASDFIQNEPRPDEAASERTDVRVVYDKDTLYFGVYAHDSSPESLIVSELKKDFTPERGDSFQVILDTFHDERNGYQFAINPAGAKWDAQVTHEGRQTNVDWDAVWFVKTRIVEDGWTAEIAIPFKTLKFRDTDIQSWGVNFKRTVRRRNEDSFWSPLPRIYDISRVSLGGTLEGLKGVKPGSSLMIKPYVNGNTEQIASGPFAWDADAGLDVKYGITPGLTWDFTLNTDFSQVEVDNQQINLTRFSLRFPEKREFFLENAGIFQFAAGADEGPNTGVPPNDMLFFHSRQIGLSGDDSAVPGVPIPIIGGTRLTGRAGRYEIGVLNLQQDDGQGRPPINFSVARVRRNILTNSDIGVIFNNKEVNDSPHYNRAVGVDANFRFSQSAALYTYLAKTSSPLGGDDDMAGRAAFHFINPAWTIRGLYVDIQQDFRNEMGFVPRAGMRKYAGFLGRNYRPVKTRERFRRFYPHVKSDYLLNPAGQLETQSNDFHFIAELSNGGSTEWGVNTYRELLLEPFTINRRLGVVIPPGLYNFYEYMVMGNTDSSRSLYGNGRVLIGPFYTGYAHRYLASGTLRLGHRLNVTTSLTHNNIDLPEGHFRTNLLSVRADYAFSTTMFLNALIQYNDDTQQWTSNVRFNLIHRPLSDLYLVYDERRRSTSGDVLGRAIIAKLTYMLVM